MKSKFRDVSNAFIDKYKISMKLKSKGKSLWFDDDEDERNIWEVTLIRPLDKKYNMEWTFLWGDCLSNTQEGVKPDLYDVISTINRFYEDDFKKWCNKYNFDKKSERMKEIWELSNKEVLEAQEFFGEAWDDFLKVV